MLVDILKKLNGSKKYSILNIDRIAEEINYIDFKYENQSFGGYISYTILVLERSLDYDRIVSRFLQTAKNKNLIPLFVTNNTEIDILFITRLGIRNLSLNFLIDEIS